MVFLPGMASRLVGVLSRKPALLLLSLALDSDPPPGRRQPIKGGMLSLGRTQTFGSDVRNGSKADLAGVDAEASDASQSF